MITSTQDFYLVCFQLLGSFCSVDFLSNRDYLISTQATVTGGFSKWPGHTPGMTFIFLYVYTRIKSLHNSRFRGGVIGACGTTHGQGVALLVPISVPAFSSSRLQIVTAAQVHSHAPDVTRHGQGTGKPNLQYYQGLMVDYDWYGYFHDCYFQMLCTHTLDSVACH